MPEHLRSFVVISVLMALAYAISRRLFAHALEPRFVDRLFAAGYGATAIMFLSHNVWVFLAGLAALTLMVARRLGQPLALFVFLMLLLPGFRAQIPGLGLINYLIDLNPMRVMAMSLLLPVALHLVGRTDVPRVGKLFSDKLVIAYALYTSFLTYLHYQTFTGGLRQLAEISLDSVLLYYVASRALAAKGAVRHVMVSLVMAAIFLALVGAFEFAKHWLLYMGLSSALGASAGGGYLMRGEILRALATTGQPIVLGYVLMVATLLSVYAQRLLLTGSGRAVLWLFMVMGSVAAMSRGPWVGAVIGLFAIALASSNPLGNLAKLTLASLGAAIALVMLPGGEKIINYLPWVGSIDASNVSFREVLWQQAQLVIGKNMWIGTIGFTEMSEFDVIRRGDGFVDIVNSYLGVTLQYGVIGLALYVLTMVSAILPNIKIIIKSGIRDAETRVYAEVLLGLMVATIITIGTVSSISYVAPLVTLVIGASVSNAWLNSRPYYSQNTLYLHRIPFGSRPAGG